MAALARVSKSDHKVAEVSKDLTLDDPPLSDSQIDEVAKVMADYLVSQATPYLNQDMTIPCSAADGSGDIHQIGVIDKLHERATTLFRRDFSDGAPYKFDYTFLTVLNTCARLKDDTQLADKAPDFLMMCSVEKQGQDLILILDVKHGPARTMKKFKIIAS